MLRKLLEYLNKIYDVNFYLSLYLLYNMLFFFYQSVHSPYLSKLI